MKKYIALITALSILEIALALYLTFWRHTFWDYIVAKNLHGFYTYIVIFTLVAITICIVTAYITYLSTLAAIKWREKLNAVAIQKQHVSIENVNQRIQQDCDDYPTLVLDLLGGAAKAVLYVVVFSATLVYEYSYIYFCVWLFHGNGCGWYVGGCSTKPS